MQKTFLTLFIIGQLFWACSKRDVEAESKIEPVIPQEKVIDEESMLEAITKGDALKVQEYISEGFDVFKIMKPNSEGDSETFLSYSLGLKNHLISEKYYQIIEILIPHSDLEVVLTKGENLLKRAIQNNDAQVVEMLLEARMKIPDGYSAYSDAIAKESLDIVKVLTRYGVILGKENTFKIINASFDREVAWAFHEEPEKNFPMTKALIDALEIDVNIEDPNNGKTLLMKAAEKGKVDFMHYLNEQGQLFLDRVDHENRSALIYAVKNAHVEAAKYLLERCSESRLKDNDNKRVCKYACAISQKSVKKNMCQVLNTRYQKEEDASEKCGPRDLEIWKKCICL